MRNMTPPPLRLIIIIFWVVTMCKALFWALAGKKFTSEKCKINFILSEKKGSKTNNYDRKSLINKKQILRNGIKKIILLW